jgi:hypothetical protein
VAALDDPMRGKGQPPIPTVAREVPVPAGVIDSTICPSGICSPGKYYATTTQSCGNGCTQQVASGAPLVVSGALHFAACSGCDVTNSFGGYIFFGGLASSGGGANVTFDPGIYVFAGAKQANNNTPGALLNTGTGLNMHDYTTATGPNTADAGELFIFTGVNAAGNFGYPGLASQVPGAVAANASLFQMGTVNFNSGNNGTTINLHGLNPQHSLIRGTPLETFGPSLLWQDQANGSVKYDATGHVDYTSCGSGYTLDNPCVNTLSKNGSPELGIQASPNIHLYGYLYQPRGAWTTLQGGGGYSGAVRLITGAVNVQGNANIDMLGLASPVTVTAVSLIE